MKKTLVLFLAFAMLFSLAACGGKDKGGDVSNPNLGVYEGTIVTMFDEDSPMNEVYPGENSIELKSGDKCVFSLDGDKIDCDWKLDGTALTIDIEGVECKGTLENGVIKIDFMGLMDMTFVKEGASAPAKPSEDSGLAGHYPVYSAVMGGQEVDHDTLVMAEVAETYLTLNADGTGEQCFEDDTPNIITDFDVDSGVVTFDTGETLNFTMDGDSISMEFPLQDMVLVFVKEDSALWDDPEAGATAGSIMAAFGQGGSDFAPLTIKNPSSWYGWLYLEGDDELFADVWGFVGSDNSGASYFEAYLDPDDTQPFMSMYVEIEDGLFLNPVIGDEDAWVNDIYIDPHEDTSIYEGRLIRDNSLLFDFEHETGHITMCFRPEGAEWDPEVNDLIPPGYEGAAGTGGESSAPAGEDYGKTTPDATGIVDYDTLKSTLKWISQQTGSEGGYARPTYEEIRDKFGCDAAKTHPDSWESDYHVYRWETSGGADFLVLSFKVAADGTETWNSSSWSQGLKD